MEKFGVEVVLFEDGDFLFRDDCDLDLYQDVNFSIVEVFIPFDAKDIEEEITSELVRMGMS